MTVSDTRCELGEGAFGRYSHGELRSLFFGITIPNAISFALDGKTACFTDTPTRRVMRVALDADGAVAFPAPHTSWPAFGGVEQDKLYCTTAKEGRQRPHDLDGATFLADAPAQGLPEYPVRIGP